MDTSKLAHGFKRYHEGKWFVKYTNDLNRIWEPFIPHCKFANMIVSNQWRTTVWYMITMAEQPEERHFKTQLISSREAVCHLDGREAWVLVYYHIFWLIFIYSVYS